MPNLMSCSEAEIESIFDRKKGNSEIEKLYTAGDKGRIETIFYSEIEPVTWYSMNPRPFNWTVTNQIYSYVPEVGHSYLFYTYLELETLALAVKEEYRQTTRIGWCRNMAAEVVISASVSANDAVAFSSIDREWLIWHPEFFTGNGYPQYQRQIGNTEILQTMSTQLPRQTLSLWQPWFYSNCSSAAFPLFYLNSQTSLVHKYRFNLNINELLRMEVLQDGVWKPVKPELHRLIGIPSDGKLSPPVLWGNMGKVRDNEIDWNRCNRKTLPIYAETIVPSSMDNLRYGSEVRLSLEPGGPVKAIFWGFRNRTAENYNIRSNYTSELQNPVDGAPVSGLVSLEYGDSPKLSEMAPHHFEYSLIREHLPSTPRVRGIYGYTFCHDVTSFGDNVAALLGSLKAKLVVGLTDPEEKMWKLDNTDIRTLQPWQPPQDAPNFSLLVRMLVMRKFTINEKGEIKRIF